MPRTLVKIQPSGKVEMEGQDFVGKQCDAVMDHITRALGGNPDTLNKIYKPEALQVDAAEQLGG